MQKNMGGMLKGIQQLQTKMAKAQNEIAAASFEGQAQGIVTVVMNGKGEITNVSMKPEALAEDAETVSLLFQIASKSAYEQKEEFTKKKLAAAGGSALPFGMKIPGLA